MNESYGLIMTLNMIVERLLSFIQEPVEIEPGGEREKIVGYQGT